MKPINGIHAAQIVRSRDKKVSIIFVTNSEDYILDGYSVFAVGYFMKPLAENAEQFSKTFTYIFPKILENQKKLSVPVKGVDIFVPFKSICYIDIDNHHHLNIHLQEKTFLSGMTYEQCFDALKDDPRFLECYHRIIVNMDFIKLMDKDDFILQDGRKVPISQRKSKFAKLKYMSYLMQTNPANTL
jgi:DNA-binding LytR/AlgR family response regulator